MVENRFHQLLQRLRGEPQVRTSALRSVIVLLLATATSAFAQSPNTAALVVLVVDQSGATVPGAQVTAINTDSGVSRAGTTDAGGALTLPALSISGAYTVAVAKSGFTTEDARRRDRFARGETATRARQAGGGGGESEVTVYGTTQGVRADPELGTRLDVDAHRRTPLLGRKISALPLLNAAFRNAKGTGDLFMNSVYVVTGAGGRREADFIVDGATGDEPWGRQTMFSTIPVGAVQEMNIDVARVLGGVRMDVERRRQHRDQIGHQRHARRRRCSSGVRAACRRRRSPPSEQCPPSVPSCVAPTTNGAATPIVPPDIPDSLEQGSFAVGGAIVKDRTHYFVAGDYTHQDRTARDHVAARARQARRYLGSYRQALFDARLDHQLTRANSLMARFNIDRFYDTNPQDAVGGNVLPSAGRQFTRHSWTGQVNETAVISPSMLNEARFVYQNADPVTAFDPLDAVDTAHACRCGAIHRRASRASPISTAAWASSPTRCPGRRAGTTCAWAAASRAIRRAATAPSSAARSCSASTPSTRRRPRRPRQLALTDMTRYQQSFNLGAGHVRPLTQWMYAVFVQDSYRVRTDLTLDLGLRYDRQTFSDGRNNFAPRSRIRLESRGQSENCRSAAAIGVYYTELRANTRRQLHARRAGGDLHVHGDARTDGLSDVLGLHARRLQSERRGGHAAGAEHHHRARHGVVLLAVLRHHEAARLRERHVRRTRRARWQRSASSASWRRVSSCRWTTSGSTGRASTRRSISTRRRFSCAHRPARCARRPRPTSRVRFVPVNGGFRQINVVENLGIADYNGLQTMLRWRRRGRYLSVSYTLSKATNTTEPNGNGAGPNDFNQLGRQEEGPSLLDQRHRAVMEAELPAAARRHRWHPHLARVGEAVQRDDRRRQQRRRHEQRPAGHRRHRRGPVLLPRDANLRHGPLRGVPVQPGARARGDVSRGDASISSITRMSWHATAPTATRGRRSRRSDRQAWPRQHRSGADVPIPGAIQFR